VVENEGLTDLDYTAFPGNTRTTWEEQHQFSQEFRLSSSKDKPVKLNDSLNLGWQSGVFLFRQSYDQHILNSVVFPNPVPPPDFIPVSNTTTADLDDWGVAFTVRPAYRLGEAGFYRGPAFRLRRQTGRF